MRTLHKLSGYVTLDQVSEALLPSLDELSSDKLWRVRHQLVELTPTLGEHLGMVFFQRDLLGRTLQWLTDSAAIIRTTAAKALCDIALAFGQEWTKDHVLGRVCVSRCVLKRNQPVMASLTIWSWQDAAASVALCILPCTQTSCAHEQPYM